MKSRPTMARDRIILAVDLDDEQAIQSCAIKFGTRVGVGKLGLEAIHAVGTPKLVRETCEGMQRKLIDGKLHDMPTTMGKASKQLAKLGVWGFTIHALAGLEGIRACVENRGEAMVFGVTVLTSHDDTECQSLIGAPSLPKVLQFAELLIKAGAQAVICSPKEAAAIRKTFGDELIIACPGIRPLWAEANDQKRSLTPAEAVAAGIDFVVIGRPILKPPAEVGGSLNAVERVVAELGG